MKEIQSSNTNMDMLLINSSVNSYGKQQVLTVLKHAKAFLLFILYYSYVSAMVPVKSPKEYYVQQEVIVLFCETVER